MNRRVVAEVSVWGVAGRRVARALRVGWYALSILSVPIILVAIWEMFGASFGVDFGGEPTPSELISALSEYRWAAGVAIGLGVLCLFLGGLLRAKSALIGHGVLLVLSVAAAVVFYIPTDTPTNPPRPEPTPSPRATFTQRPCYSGSNDCGP